MTEDKFLERLRSDAEQLRYTPSDPFIWTRLAARVRERLRGQATVAQMLAHWFRPITASFLTLALAAALTVSWVESREPAYNSETMSANSLEITVDGDTYSLAE
jgi:hypothetical protein